MLTKYLPVCFIIMVIVMVEVRSKHYINFEGIKQVVVHYDSGHDVLIINPAYVWLETQGWNIKHICNAVSTTSIKNIHEEFGIPNSITYHPFDYWVDCEALWDDSD